QLDHQDDIAARRATAAGAALAGDADPRAVVDPGRNLHFQAARLSGGRVGDLECARSSIRRLFQGYLNAVLQVFTPPPVGACAAALRAGCAADAAEVGVEEVGEAAAAHAAEDLVELFGTDIPVLGAVGARA